MSEGTGIERAKPVPGCPEPIPPQVADVLPYPLLEEDGSYTPVIGEPSSMHLERLALIRRHLLDVFTGMGLDDFRTPRPSGDGEVTPEWVLMHLARHESEHRGQIWVARTAAEASQGEESP